MFTVNSNNYFFKKIFIELFIQKNIPISLDETQYFSQINFKINNEKIEINFIDQKISINFPVHISDLFKKVLDLIASHKIKFGNLNYSPINQCLSIQNNEIKLGFTHSIIITTILENINRPIEKSFIYRKIWPGDNEISINKLDTHLTNLKNLLMDKLSYELKFVSNKGQIKFLIN